MSKENYIQGFSKIAESKGLDPEKLASFALRTKLQKTAFFGAFKGLASAGRNLAKVAPAIGRGAKFLGKEFITNIRNPQVQVAMGGAGLGMGLSDYFKNRTSINAYVKRLLTPSTLRTSPATPVSTNSIPNKVQAPSFLQ